MSLHRHVALSERSRATCLGSVGLALALIGLVLGLGVVSPSPASADTSAAPGACGSILLPGTAWLGGGGVNVYSNGNSEGKSSNCVQPTTYNTVNGVRTGQEWQCVELVNRLYLTKGWITTTWSGDAGTPFWNNAPASLSKELNGHVSYLGPGDVVDINETFTSGGVTTFIGGHVLIVNSSSKVTSGSSVQVVSQNSGSPSSATYVKTATLSAGSVTISGSGGGYAYQTIGVIHAPAPATLPAQPANPHVVSTTTSSAVLAWTDASNNEDRFVTQYKTATGNWVAGPTVGANATSVTIGGLASSTAYTFQVGAQNAAGTKWSVYAGGSTPAPPVTLPAQPANPHVVSVTSSSAVLGWSDASNNETGFVTQYKTATGNWVAGPTVGANATSVTIGALSSSTAYTFQVGARNSAGTHWSGYASGTTSAPPVTLPAQPGSPRVVSVTSSSAVLAWTDTSNNETGFVTQFKTATGSWVAGPSVGAGATSVTIGGLSASTPYTFQVASTNAAGPHWSAYAYGTTSAPPPPPVNLGQYANSIVKQNNGSSIAWWVTSDLKRLWIPDGGTYNQLVARYHPAVYQLSSSILNQLPDQTNQWAASGASWGANREMRRGMSVTSANGIYTLAMQGDGNLVLYNNAGRALWATNTGGRGASTFAVQDDGNLVLYAGGSPVWASNTSQAKSVQLAWGNVSGHTGAGDNYSAGPVHAKGSSITILCYVNGALPNNRNPASTGNASWYNDALWDRATDGYYYSDAWLKTGSTGPVVPHC